MRKTMEYVDIVGKRHEVRWSELLEAIERVRALFSSVKRRFVERESVIDQIKHAMLLREHILINGPSGAAKSMLIRAITKAITNARLWSMDLTRFTTNSQVFGGYDARQLRETGHSIHLTEFSAADAHFIQLGEFFDAPPPTLRTLLGLLNERRIRNGPQLIEPPLLTAIGDTNFSMEMLTEKSQQQLAAVVDRFLFREEVDYVVEPANRRQMLAMSLDPRVQDKLPQVSLDDIVMISGVVKGMNLMLDPYIIDAYEEMTRRYSALRQEKGGLRVSDRRYVRGAQIMEVSALLHGRQAVTFEDLAITRYVLAHNENDVDMLIEIKKGVIGTWVKRASRREIESELHRLAQVIKDLPKSDNVDIESMKLDELKAFASQLEKMQSSLQEFKTDSLEVGQKVAEWTRAILALQHQAVHHGISLIEQMIPETTTNMSAETVGPVGKQVNIALNELRSVPTLSDDLIVRQSEVMVKALQARHNVDSSMENLGVVSKEG